MYIRDFLAEAMIYAETPRSLKFYKALEDKKGELSIFDGIAWLEAISDDIKPEEKLKELGLNVEDLILRIKQAFKVDATPEMSVGQLCDLVG